MSSKSLERPNIKEIRYSRPKVDEKDSVLILDKNVENLYTKTDELNLIIKKYNEELKNDKNFSLDSIYIEDEIIQVSYREQIESYINYIIDIIKNLKNPDPKMLIYIKGFNVGIEELRRSMNFTKNYEVSANLKELNSLKEIYGSLSIDQILGVLDRITPVFSVIKNFDLSELDISLENFSIKFPNIKKLDNFERVKNISVKIFLQTFFDLVSIKIEHEKVLQRNKAKEEIKKYNLSITEQKNKYQKWLDEESERLGKYDKKLKNAKVLLSKFIGSETIDIPIYNDEEKIDEQLDEKQVETQLVIELIENEINSGIVDFSKKHSIPDIINNETIINIIDSQIRICNKLINSYKSIKIPVFISLVEKMQKLKKKLQDLNGEKSVDQEAEDNSNTSPGITSNDILNSLMYGFDSLLIQESEKELQSNKAVRYLKKLMDQLAGGVDGTVYSYDARTSWPDTISETYKEYEKEFDALKNTRKLFKENSVEEKWIAQMVELCVQTIQDWRYAIQVIPDDTDGVRHKPSELPNYISADRERSMAQKYGFIERKDNKNIKNGPYFEIKQIALFLLSGYKTSLEDGDTSDDINWLPKNIISKLTSSFTYNDYVTNSSNIWKAIYALFYIKKVGYSDQLFSSVFESKGSFYTINDKKYDEIYNNLCLDLAKNKQIGNVGGAKFIEQQKDEMSLYLKHVKMHLIFSNLMGQAYTYKALRGSSSGHTGWMYENGKRNFEFISNPFAQACYLIENDTDEVEDNLIMWISLYTDNAVEKYFKKFAINKKVSKKIIDAREKMKAYYAQFLGSAINDIFGILDEVEEFPQMDEAIFVGKPPVDFIARFFNVDMQGLQGLIDNQFHDYLVKGERQKNPSSFNKDMRDFIKNRFGKAKLHGGLLPGRTLSAMVRLKIFSFLQGMKVNYKELGIKSFINEILGASTEIASIAEELFDGIKKSTTANYMGNVEELFYKKGTLELDKDNKYYKYYLETLKLVDNQIKGEILNYADYINSMSSLSDNEKKEKIDSFTKDKNNVYKKFKSSVDKQMFLLHVASELNVRVAFVDEGNNTRLYSPGQIDFDIKIELYRNVSKESTKDIVLGLFGMAEDQKYPKWALQYKHIKERDHYHHLMNPPSNRLLTHKFRNAMDGLSYYLRTDFHLGRPPYGEKAEDKK